MSIKSFFTYSGRIGRLAFLKEILVLFFVVVIPGILVAVAVNSSSDSQSVYPLIFAMMLSLFQFWIFSYPFVRRLHDLDWSGYVYLLALIPIGNIILFFCLCLAGGKHHVEEYRPIGPS